MNNDRAQELRRYEIDRRRWSVQEFHVIIVLLKDRDGVKRVRVMKPKPRSIRRRLEELEVGRSKEASRIICIACVLISCGPLD